MKMSLVVLIAPIALLTACGDLPAKVVTPKKTVTASSTPSPTPTARPNELDCRTVLSQYQARELLGTKVAKPFATYIGELEGCRWPSRDGKRLLGAASMPAGEWVQALPALLDSARSIMEEFPGGAKAVRQLEKMMKQKVYRTNRQGCELFRTYIHALYRDLEEGTDVVIFYLPDEKKTEIVAGQSCVNGHFRSFVYAQKGGVTERDAVADRIEDALLAGFVS